MSKPAAIFVAAAMAVTAGCVGVIASYGLGLGMAGSLLAGAGALAGMAVVHLAFLRVSPQDDARLDDLDRVVTELQSRLETLELRVSTIDGATAERARSAAKPLVAEIAALGGLLTTIAKEVASHDVSIARLSAPRPMPQSVSPAKADEPPAQPAARSSADLAPAPPPTSRSEPPRPASLPASPKLQRPEPLDLDAPEARKVDPRDLPDMDLSARIERALSEDRVEPHLQPIVTLPSRRTAHYEAFSRIVEEDGLLPAADFLDAARELGRIAEIDRRTIERCAAVALRLSARGGGAVFVNIAAETLKDANVIGAMTSLFERQEELRRLIVLEFGQTAFAALDPDGRKAVERFVAQGVRLSLDGAVDLRFEPRELTRLGVRFVKVAADRLLDPDGARGAAIHPADLANLLARHGVDLIATHVEQEKAVPELLDMEVAFAQGALFGMPRPVRPATPEEPVAQPAAASQPQAARLAPRSAAAR